MLDEYAQTVLKFGANCTTMAEIQHFCYGIVFYWRTLYINKRQRTKGGTYSLSSTERS